MNRFRHRQPLLNQLTSLALAAFLMLSPSVGMLSVNAEINQHAEEVNKLGTGGDRPTGNLLNLNMTRFNDPDGYTLKTVRTERQYSFTRPKGWIVLPASSLHLVFQHSPALLPERSSLNILVNNRILKTIPLAKDNVTPTSLNILVPPSLLKDNNTLTFQVDQHYTYKCEDPFSAELWTTILPETNLALHYNLAKSDPNLAEYPYPILDPLNNYAPTTVGYLIPPGRLSSESLEAFGVVAAHLGQQAKWRTVQPFIADESALSANQNLVLVGTPEENPSIAALSNLPLSGNQFSDQSGKALPADAGVLQLIPNPQNPTRTILLVSGNSPKGVAKAAHVLAEGTANKLLVGRSAIIKDFNAGAAYPYRAWDGFVHASGDIFNDLGLNTQTARGITALPLFYHLKLMPDIFLPGRKKAHLNTVYSYASQLDASQSKLEVRLNGKAIKSIPLTDPKGKSLAEFAVDIPTEDLHTFNDLEYQFHLYPEKYDMCRFVTDVHIWGTVHNTTKVEFPGEIKAALPDVGLINDGGYPFTAYQDMSHVSVVLPDSPSSVDLMTMLQFLTRLGRESASHKGIELSVYTAGALPDSAKKDSHLVLIGQKKQHKLMGELDSKTSLLTEGTWNTLKENQKQRIAQLQYNPNQGLVEEMLSPWNDKRVVLLLSGENDTALYHTAQLFENDDWFVSIKPGNLVVVNDQGPQSLILLKKGEARFFYPHDLKEGFQLPSWVWIIVGFLALLGLLSLLRFLFGR